MWLLYLHFAIGVFLYSLFCLHHLPFSKPLAQSSSQNQLQSPLHNAPSLGSLFLLNPNSAATQFSTWNFSFLVWFETLFLGSSIFFFISLLFYLLPPICYNFVRVCLLKYVSCIFACQKCLYFTLTHYYDLGIYW